MGHERPERRVRVGQSGWNRSRRRAESRPARPTKALLRWDLGMKSGAVVEEDDAVGEGFWWREEKLETRSRKVEVRKWKLESESGWSDGEAESGGCLHR